MPIFKSKSKTRPGSTSSSSSYKPTKGMRITQAEHEYKEALADEARLNHKVEYLKGQRRIDSRSRHAYVKATEAKLNEAYAQLDSAIALTSAKLRQLQACHAEVESSSDDNRSVSSRSSTFSKRSNPSGYGGSNASTAPTWLAWLCRCGIMNFNDPEGPDNRCGCGHLYCGNPNCCEVQFNP